MLRSDVCTILTPSGIQQLTKESYAALTCDLASKPFELVYRTYKWSYQHPVYSNAADLKALISEEKAADITMVVASGCNVGQDFCDAITNLKNVLILYGSQCNLMNDAAVGALSKLNSLTMLDLSRCESITDAGMKEVSKLTNLTTLNLTGCKAITDIGVRELSHLSSLNTLKLSECVAVKGKGLSKLTTVLRRGYQRQKWKRC
eukprot:PhF_6_TR40397/c0_g1_i4/m.60187